MSNEAKNGVGILGQCPGKCDVQTFSSTSVRFFSKYCSDINPALIARFNLTRYSFPSGIVFELFAQDSLRPLGSYRVLDLISSGSSRSAGTRFCNKQCCQKCE